MAKSQPSPIFAFCIKLRHVPNHTQYNNLLNKQYQCNFKYMSKKMPMQNWVYTTNISTKHNYIECWWGSWGVKYIQTHGSSCQFIIIIIISAVQCKKEALSDDNDNHIDDPRKIDSYPAHKACSTEAIGEVAVMFCTIVIASSSRGLRLRGSYTV